MKNRNIITYVLFAVVFFLISCEEGEHYRPIHNQVFIAQTNTNSNVSKKIVVGLEKVTTELNARVSNPAEQDFSVTFNTDEKAIEEFNKRNGTNYLPLPKENFNLSDTKKVIKKGGTLSSPIRLTINPLSKKMKDSGKKYAVALKVNSLSDGGVLKGANTIVYILDQVVITPVPVINSSNNLKMVLRQDYELKEWTVEYCVNVSVLGTEIGQMNNQTMFGAWGADGGEIYTRFGDAPIEGNRFQIKTQGTQMNSNQLFTANTWYQIAIVCTGEKLYLYVNGTLDNSMDLPNKTVKISKDNVQFGNMDYLRADVQLSELRFWTVARSQAEIVNNLYSVDPQTKGLEAYWKLNEGKGNSFKDSTGHDNKCDSKGATQWIPNVRIDGK
ncbi:MAG: DUF1735 and LamG domain-containing protein [Flavobacteriaceae bacterium]|nr:DUF1735 and LamG domain-containing protein [Flavobacteriaceae bacterium]